MIKRKSSDNTTTAPHRHRMESFNEEEEHHKNSKEEKVGEETAHGIENPGRDTDEAEETQEEEPGVEKEEVEDETEKMSPEEEARNLALVTKREETKLKAKYPGLKARGGGGSSFLAQKKLQRGHKYFDSGDYNLVKGKKKPLSGEASGSSRTKPEVLQSEEVSPEVQELEAEKENKQQPFTIATSEQLSEVIPTPDVITSHRMSLYRTRSESQADEIPSSFPRTMRSGSMFVSSPSGGAFGGLPQVTGTGGGIRRGSMFPMMPSSGGSFGGSDVITPPSAEFLQRRRQSMIPAIPSKLTQ